MASYELYRHDLTLLKDYSGADARQIAAGSATVAIYRKGARVSAGGSGTGSQVLSVSDPGTVGLNDTVVLGTGSTTGTVSAIAASTVTVTWSSSVTWAAGDRIIPTNRRPTAYSDSQGATSLGNSVTTDSSGNAAFYTRAKDIDAIATVGATSRVIADLSGMGGPPGLNPFDWGCAIDGSTDDIAPFTNLLAYAAIKGGQEVLLPAGTMVVSTAITPTTSVAIRGKGRGITYIQGSTAGNNIITTASASDVKIEGITFKRSGSGTTGIPLVVLGNTRPVLRDLEIQSGTIGIFDAATDATVTDVIFTGGGWEKLIYCIGTTRSHYTSIRSRFTNDIGATDAAVYIGDGCTGLRFLNCDIAPSSVAAGGNSGTAVYFATAGGTATKDVVFSACRLAGGLKTGSERAGVWIASGKSLQFTGCTVEDSLVGYDVDGGTDVKVFGGSVLGCGKESFDVDGGTMLRIVESTSSDCSQTTNNTYAHVNFGGTADQCYINGLTVGRQIRGGTNKGTYGVVIGSGVTICQVLGMRGSLTDLNNGWFSNSSTAADLDISHNMETGSPLHSYSHTGLWGTGRGTLTVTTAAATYDVKNVGTIYLQQSAPTTITGFTNATNGQVLRLMAGNGNTTINDGGNFALQSNFNLGQDDTLTLVYNETTGFWDEVSRSNN